MKKVKEWIEKTGLTSLAYLIIAVLALVLLDGKFSWAVFGAAIGIFGYVNANVIYKLALGEG